MIEMKIDMYVEELHEDEYVNGIQFVTDSFDEELVGVQIGNGLIEVSKKDLIHMVKSLVY